MKSNIYIKKNTGKPFFSLTLVLLIGMLSPTVLFAGGPGGPAGLDIKVRAINFSTDDTPFCLSGGGQVGDKLSVDAFMNQDGEVTGTATFEDADGNVTVIDIDRAFGFGPGLLVQNNTNQNTVAMWMSDTLMTPVQLNIELPRGCGNTVSTFTPGVDKVTVQLKFR